MHCSEVWKNVWIDVLENCFYSTISNLQSRCLEVYNIEKGLLNSSFEWFSLLKYETHPKVGTTWPNTVYHKFACQDHNSTERGNLQSQPGNRPCRSCFPPGSQPSLHLSLREGGRKKVKEDNVPILKQGVANPFQYLDHSHILWLRLSLLDRHCICKPWPSRTRLWRMVGCWVPMQLPGERARELLFLYSPLVSTKIHGTEHDYATAWEGIVSW